MFCSRSTALLERCCVWQDVGIGGKGGGVCHSCEIPFVFNAANFLETAVERELAMSMARYWVEFAATGSPGTGAGAGSQVRWPAYERGGESVMRLGRQKAGGASVEAGLRGAACDLWDSLPYPYFTNASGWEPRDQ